jgi:glutamate/tyrosine decarboxylase-like PLP-dependent enzyme
MTRPQAATTAAGTSGPTAPPNIIKRSIPIDADRLDLLRRDLAAPLPHPGPDELRAAGRQALDWLLDRHAALPDQPIGRSASRADMERLLREPPPENGRDFAAVLAEFAEKVDPFGVRVNHPRFLAFIPGAPSFVSVLGDLLCAGTNFFAGVWLEASGPTEVELVVLDWFREFLKMPPGTAGILTSGGSEANLTALVAARERLSEKERSRAILYVGEQRHWSIDRAAKIMGMRPDQLRPVPDDDDFRLTPAALARGVDRDRREGLLPWAVVANAGATNTGSVDPLSPLADWCAAERLWLHVDAAYGWTGVLAPEQPDELSGIGRADSVTLDPHKMLAQVFEAGCVLVRDGRLLRQAFTLRPEYMQDVAPAEDEVNFADHGIALTRRFRALKIWLSMKVLGVGWFRALAERCRLLAEYGQALLERDGRFEILSPRQLSIVCFRFRPAAALDEPDLDRLNLALIDAVRATGRAFLSSTRLRGRTAIRFCFVNWRTTAADVEEIVRLLGELGEQLAGRERQRHFD